MKHLFKWDKKYLYWGITAFCVIAACIMFFMAFSYLPLITGWVKRLVSILNPFIWGLIIAYLLLPLERLLQNSVFIPVITKINVFIKSKAGKRFARFNKETNPKTIKNVARGISVFLSEIIMVAVLALLVYLIIPQLLNSMRTIVDNSGMYVTTLTSWLEGILKDYPEIEELVVPKVQDFNATFLTWVQTTVMPGLGNLASSVTTGVISAVRGVFNLFIGVIVSMYLLFSKSMMIAHAKKLLYSIFSVEMVSRMFKGMKFVDRTFMGFINGKLLDSLIMGIICYICCALLRMPYTLLVSVIVGVTNIIPFFGPFIGAIPCTLIILLVNPIKGLIFIVLILVLQQIDGNIIGPRILGSSVGINGFWVLFSITVGSGLFGFWGMVLGVPVFTVIYAVCTKLVNDKLKKSGLPVETATYMGIDHIDPVSYEPVPKTPRPVHELKLDIKMPDLSKLDIKKPDLSKLEIKKPDLSKLDIRKSGNKKSGKKS